MDVARWLRGLGLQRYEPAFRENDVDAEILPELTGDDLVGLGVTSVGHRRKLPAAIAVLRAEISPTVGSGQRSEPGPMSFSTSGSGDAERRQLTVMFSDLVGSTALSSSLDPEDLRDVIGAYHKCVTEVVERFDGFVAKYMGDWHSCLFRLPTSA
jgi:hypothetical protein